MGEFYEQLRSLFEYANVVRDSMMDGARPAVPIEGSASVDALRKVRLGLGMLVPSRLYADTLIIVVLTALVIVFTFSIFSNCRTLGCAMLRLVTCCFCLVLLVFWLVTAMKLSNEEFHSTFVDSAQWAASALNKVVARK